MTKRNVTIERIDASLKRWHTRLKRAATAIDKLQRQRNRLAAKAAPQPHWPAFEREQAKVKAQADEARLTQTEGDKLIEHVADQLGIPAFLKRTPADTAAIDAVKAEQDDRAKRKKAGQEARRKAARRGDTKRMPLQGKEALAVIRQA